MELKNVSKFERKRGATLFKYSLWQEFQALEMCICCFINDVILFGFLNEAVTVTNLPLLER